MIRKLNDFRNHFSLSAQGRVWDTSVDVVDADTDLFMRKRQDAQVLADLAANARGPVLQIGCSKESHTFNIAANLPADTLFICADFGQREQLPYAKSHPILCDDAGTWHRYSQVARISCTANECQPPRLPCGFSLILIDALSGDDVGWERLYREAYAALSLGGLLVWYYYAPLDSMRQEFLATTKNRIDSFLKAQDLADAIVYPDESWMGIVKKHIEISPVTASTPLVQPNRSSSGRSASGPLRVLFLYDEQGWAWHHKAEQIKMSAPADIQIEVKRDREHFRPEDYDYILVFEVYVITKVLEPAGISVPSTKAIVGCSSSAKTLGETLDCVARKHARAGFVNNLESYNKVSDPRHFYCCQNGVDDMLFRPADDAPSDFSACWVGNTAAISNKGLDTIFEACNLAGVPLRYLDRNATKDRLFTHDEIRDKVYHPSSVYICASEQEGTPNPALEALACGLPVISTRVGNMPEIIVDGVNGYLVDGSAVSIAEALNKIRMADLNEMRFRARMSIAGGWSWRQKAENYFAMLRELAAQDGILYGPPKSAIDSSDNNDAIERLEQQISNLDPFFATAAATLLDAQVDGGTCLLRYEEAKRVVVSSPSPEDWLKNYIDCLWRLTQARTSSAPESEAVRRIRIAQYEQLSSAIDKGIPDQTLVLLITSWWDKLFLNYLVEDIEQEVSVVEEVCPSLMPILEQYEGPITQKLES